MHEIIKAVILGIVEGITEFLPISSTGHLILVNQFVAFSEPFTKKFDVIILDIAGPEGTSRRSKVWDVQLK